MISLRLESYSLISNKMNFKKILLASAIFGALFVTSCKNSEEGPIVPVDITVNPVEMDIDSVAGTYNITLKSNMPWHAECVVDNPWGDEEKNFEKDPWISVSPESGEATEGQTVTITVKANDLVTTEDTTRYHRAVVVYFRTDEHIYATTVVNQSGGKYALDKPNSWEQISISDLREAYTPKDQSSIVTVNDPVYIVGTVVSSNNPQTMSSKNLYVQDDTAPHSGLLVYTDAASSLAFGSEVEVRVKGGTMKYYYGQLELELSSSNVTKLSDGDGTAEYAEIEGADLVNGDYDGQYVRIFAQVVQADLGKAMKDSPSVETEDGSTFLMYSREEPSWAGSKVPQGAGPLYGLVGSYNAKYQIVPQKESDFAGMTEARFTGRPTVILEEAVLNEEKTTMTLSAKYEYAGEAKDITEVGFVYRVKDAEDSTIAKAELGASFKATVENLKASTAYDYYAYVKIGERVYKSETKSVSTSVGALAVSDVVALIKEGKVEEGASLATFGAFMEGIVVANNDGGNYYQKYSVVDGTGEQATGIVVYRSGNEELKIGDKIRLSLGNAKYSPYSGLREITFDGNAEITVLESGVEYVVPELTAADFNAGDWQGMYVTVTGLASSHVDGTLWCDEKKDETKPGEVVYKTTNRTFISGNEEVLVRNTAHAEWAKLPIKAGVTGKISGAVEQYKDDLQIYPVKASDIADFTTVPAK